MTKSILKDKIKKRFERSKIFFKNLLFQLKLIYLSTSRRLQIREYRKSLFHFH